MNQQEIEAGVHRAEKALKEAVVQIRYRFADDWAGEPSIFYLLLITDEAAKRSKLGELLQSGRDAIRREIDSEEHGLHSYFTLRSFAEQVELNDPDWT